MANIRKKYETNIELAQELINKKYYTNSIHCSYYGCLQLAKYFLDKKEVCSYETQNNYKGDSHIFILGKLLNSINSPSVIKSVRTAFESLKIKRVKADYHDHIFEAEESLIAIDEAKGFICKINNILGGK